MNPSFSFRLITLSLSIFLFGCVISIISYDLTVDTHLQTKSIQIFNKSHDFFNIFRNNISVGLLISVGGYLSGGVLSTIILLYNGYLLTDIIQSALILKIPQTEILYGLIYHSPLELTAFFLFASLGFKGFNFYKTLLFNNRIEYRSIPSVKALIFPTSLLVVAAIIESNL